MLDARQYELHSPCLASGAVQRWVSPSLAGWSAFACLNRYVAALGLVMTLLSATEARRSVWDLRVTRGGLFWF